jgi:hypothetical protein
MPLITDYYACRQAIIRQLSPPPGYAIIFAISLTPFQPFRFARYAAADFFLITARLMLSS